MNELQEKILAEARSWIGTPFCHQGRVKGSRIDCIGHIEMVARELRLAGMTPDTVVPQERIGYSRYPVHGILDEVLDEYMVRIPMSKLDVADVITMRRPGDLKLIVSHCGFYSERDTVIHALFTRTIKACSEHSYSSFWKQFAAGAYRFPELCN